MTADKSRHVSWLSTGCNSTSSGTCCWRTHVEPRMSNSDFNCNKWSRVCHYPDFWWRDHYLPQMPLLFWVSIRPEASTTTKKSRRCLCVDAHLISAINWQLSGFASRPSICCCRDVWLWSASICALVRVGSGRLQKICDLWFCACRHLCSLFCGSLSGFMKLML